MKIVLLSPIDPATIEGLSSEHDVIRAFEADGAATELVREGEIVIFRSGVTVSGELMDEAPNLRLLIRAGSGLDNVDAQHARKRGIRLVRIPSPAAQSVAEFTFALMLDLARNVSLADRAVRAARWPKHELAGRLVSGKTLSIVGCGNIGSRVGELGHAWAMEAIGCVDGRSPELEESLLRRGIRLTTFDEVLSRADYLTIHVPLTPATRHLIDAAALARMKRGSFLINVARGGVVDEAALRAELADGGRLRGAALDVHEREGDGESSPLADLPNVVLTPHIGAMTAETQHEIGRRILELVAAFTAGSLDHAGRNGELLV
jgi:D-3-phosphoglycerate dehydrogenase